MSTSSLELTEKGEELEQQEVPKWLESFLKKTFFSSCLAHDQLQKNEQNRYCITCDEPACRYCISQGFHEQHKWLKIYRHVYKDVVPLSEMEDQINCSKIQPYKCNKKWVIALNPLPHCGSGSQIVGNANCDTCLRKLYEPHQFRFCSISCKVKALKKKSDDGANKDAEGCGPSTNLMNEVDDGVVNNNVVEVEGRRRKRRRKGVPCRAPRG